LELFDLPVVGGRTLPALRELEILVPAGGGVALEEETVVAHALVHEIVDAPAEQRDALRREHRAEPGPAVRRELCEHAVEVERVGGSVEHDEQVRYRQTLS